MPDAPSDGVPSLPATINNQEILRLADIDPKPIMEDWMNAGHVYYILNETEKINRILSQSLVNYATVKMSLSVFYQIDKKRLDKANIK